MADEPLLDPRVLAQLRMLQIEGEPDIVAELAALFLAEEPRRLARLASEDPALAQLAAHSLRGCAGQLGAARLARVCATIEAATAPDAASVDAVRRELEAVRPLLLALVESRRS